MHRIKPNIHFLNKKNIQDIHQASLEVLHTKGVRIHSGKMVQILKHETGIIIENDIIKFEPEIVEYAIKSAPAKIDIYNRTGEFRFTVGAKKQTRFGIGVTNLWYEDPKSGEFLEFSRALIAESTQLGHHLPGYDIISTPGIIRDTQTGNEDLYCTLEMIANTTKPLVILVSDPKQFKNVIQLCEHLIPNLKERPSIIPYFNSKTPLVYDEGTLDNIITAIDHDLPIIISNYGMMGSSTPFDPYKALVLLNAELLAGLVFSQLIKRGTPVIMGSLPAIFDMKSMVSYYNPKSMLANLACAEIMKHYKIPHAGTSGSGTGWTADLRGASTLWMNHLTGMLGKVGLAPFVGSNFDSMVFSPTTVVHANIIIELARRFEKGFLIPKHKNVIEEINMAEIGGDYFTSPETLEKMDIIRELRNDIRFMNLSFENWKELGSPDVYDMLKDYTTELMRKAIPPGDCEEMIGKGEALINSWQ